MFENKTMAQKSSSRLLRHDVVYRVGFLNFDSTMTLSSKNQIAPWSYRQKYLITAVKPWCFRNFPMITPFCY